MSGSPSIPFDALLTHSSWLRRLASHLVSDPDQADDLVHETWALALENPPASGIDPRRWLARVMRNRAKNRYREASLKQFHETSASRSEAWSPAEIEQRVSLQKQVAEAVFGLEEPYRTAITLHYFEEMSAEEIAQRQGTTAVNVRKQLSRGREMLRWRLDREFGGRKAWSVLFLQILRKGSAAPVAAGTGKVVALTAVAAALAILSLFTWSRVRTRDIGRHESIAAVAIEESESRSRIRDEPPVYPTPSRRQAVGGLIPKDDPEKLRGLVMDASNHFLQGVRISVFRDGESGYSWDPDATVQRQEITAIESNAQGEFAVTVPPGRPVGLEASADGYGTATLDYRHAGETVIVQLGAGAVLEGRVSRASGGTPVSGARLEISTEQGTIEGGRLLLRTGETDEAGRFRFENLPGISVSVRLMPRSQGAPASRAVTIEPGGTSTADFAILDGKTVRVKALDSETQRPIPNAEVGETGVHHRLFRVDGNGEYVYTGLRDTGPITLTARADGYSSEVRVFRQSSNLDDLPAEVDFKLTRSVRVQGRVLDSQRHPVEGAYVAAVSNRPNDPISRDVARIRGRTDDRGRFDLPDVSRDLAVTLLVRHEGSGTLAMPCLARNSGASTVVEVADLVLPPASSLSGSVVDESGIPARNWTVRLSPDDLDLVRNLDVAEPMPIPILKHVLERTSRTDDQGHFMFADLSSGTYSVSAQVPNSQVQITRVVSISETPYEGLRLEVPRLESIGGRAIDSAGRGVSGISITVVAEQDPLGPRYYGLADAGGNFSVNGLASGGYRVLIDQVPGSAAFLARPLRNVPAGARDVKLLLESTTVIRGRLLDADGHDAGGGTVWGWVPGRDEWFSVLTNADGSFALPVPLDVSVELAALPSGIKYRPLATVLDSPDVARQRVLSSSANEVILRLPR